MQKFKNIVFVIISTLVLANCGGGGGGGGGSEPAPVPTPPPAPTASISANPTTLWVNESVTLTWSSTNATGCSAGGEWSGDNKDPSGEESVTVTKDGELTYSITCSSGTRSATSEVVITANPINQTGKYTNEDGTYVYIEAEQGNLFNTPAKWTYSLREHGGYTYPNSETGEPIILDGGWYDNRIKTCRSADLNGDEYPDVVAQSVWNWQAQPTSQPEDMLNPERRPRVHFFINDGQGKFSDAQDIILGEDYYRMNTYKDLAIGDLNNDGLDDIITPSGSGGVLLWQVVDDGILLLMSNAEGKYEDKTSLINFPRITRDRGDFTEEVLGLGGAEGIGIIDVNSDGWKDIVMFTIAQPEQGYRFPLVLLNNEGESFEPWDRYKNDNSPFLFTEWVAMRDAQVADFDNDGDEDMFLLCYTDCWRESSSLYEAGSNTGFVLINDEGDFNKENIVHFPEGTLSDVNKNDAMSVGDINGDGLVDIVIAQGKSDPYYVSRNIQILINTGEGFSDETEARIENLRNDFNGHPEGNIFLIDYDNDGDLDIFDYQDNVRNGYSTSNNNAPTEEDKKFPYWKNGGALFLNDGGGIFTYQEEDTTTTGELPNLFEPWKMATFNEPYHICPVDFGEGYGYGFGFSGGPGEEAPNVNPPEGEPYVDYNLEGFAFGRKVSNQDNFRQE